MIEHALNGKMRLAGVGRPENRDETRCRTEHGHGHKSAVASSTGQEPGWHFVPFWSAFATTCGNWSDTRWFGTNPCEARQVIFRAWLVWVALIAARAV